MTVDSVNDCLGILAPLVFTSTKILQETCKRGVSWDQLDLHEEVRWRWEQWKFDLLWLKELRIPNWFILKRNLKIDNTLIVQDEVPRNESPLGKIMETSTDQQGLVCSVKINVFFFSDRISPIEKACDFTFDLANFVGVSVTKPKKWWTRSTLYCTRILWEL